MHLRVEGVSKSFGGVRVLTNISLNVGAGERIGLIGENGSGKSTLLHIIAGRVAPDRGVVHAAAPGGGSLRLGLLFQEPPFLPHETIHSALASATAHVTAAIDALSATATALAADSENPLHEAAYVAALDEAERLGAWEIESRVESVLTGLGIGTIPRERPTGDLSGGERARLSLAWVLLHSPDVLLLDEPTNHLDDRATAYLGRLLAQWAGPVLIASHDRAFLDETVTSLIDLEPAHGIRRETESLVQDGRGSAIGVSMFTGSFSNYLHAQKSARLRWERQYQEEQAELERLRAGLSGSYVVGHEDWKPRTESRMAQKFYGDRNAKVVSRRVNDARSRLETLEADQVRQPPTELKFAGIRAPLISESSLPIETPVLQANGISIASRLHPVSFELAHDQKLLITGANGAGKSTLLKVLSGSLASETGQVTLRSGVRIGQLDQEVSFADPRKRGMARTALEVYIDGVGVDRAEATPLSTFGLLLPRDECRPVRELSVGQQRRLALAILLADPPNILLLDEPTNHLSLTLTEALEEAIAAFPGAVIVASHDRWLRQRWNGSTLTLEERNPRNFQ